MSSSNLSDEEVQKRIREAKAKFDHNLSEFKRKKLTDIPCFRSTFLTSIPSSLVVGVLSYLFTGRTRFASNLAFGSFFLVTSVYFTKCRIEFNRKVEENKELGELMNMIVKYKGTELEEQFQKKYSEKVKEMDTKSKFV